MIFRRLTYLFAFVSALALGGCSESNEELPQPEQLLVETYMRLSVRSAESSSLSSRTEFPTEDGFLTGSEGENIRTMRFIITYKNEQGIEVVEHNVVVNNTNTDSKQPVSSGDLLVRPRQLKTIYLIGNMDGLPDDPENPDERWNKIRNLTNGDELPRDFAMWTISMAQNQTPSETPEEGENEGKEEKEESASPTPGSSLFPARGNIPMTEIYQYYVGPSTSDDEYKTSPLYYEANLFATRAAVKFVFELTIENDLYKDKDGNFMKPDFVTINSIGNTEYLFPHETAYYPEKPDYYTGKPEGDSQATERAITAYSIPTSAKNSPFTAAWDPDPVAGSPNKFTAGPVYLPETDNGGVYTVTLRINGADLTSEPLQNLPKVKDLPALPRNSYVAVNMTLKKNAETIECTTIVVPYIGIDLKPNFGFEDD